MFVQGRIRSDIVALCSLLCLMVFGILGPEQALSGFSNSIVVMMVGLFVVGGAIFRTGLAKMIGGRIAEHVNVQYVFQETSDIPEKYKALERVKPWGTGHAVLCCRGTVNEPFAVINADDYYGKEAFVKLYERLTEEISSDGMNLSMAGFILKNTLSDNGAVTRGICTVDDDNNLVEIKETYNIRRENGRVLAGNGYEVSEDSYVSMNMWGCPPEFIDILGGEFEEFLEKYGNDPKAEFLLPIVIDKLLKSKTASCRLLESRDRWFGVTYAEDKRAVSESICRLISEGVYPEKLW